MLKRDSNVGNYVFVVGPVRTGIGITIQKSV